MIKAFLKLIKLNLVGYPCPDCFEKYSGSTKFYIVYDKQYKNWKYYMKCKKCGTTTPAFEEPKKCFEMWEDNVINKEIKLFEEL